MTQRSKRIRNIYILFWILLIYILAALIWWFVALNRQNHEMARLKLKEPGANTEAILDMEKRKTTQYIGEGIIFLLMIGAGAVYIYYSVRSRLQQTQQQEDFMMAITHELKTPIAVASLNLETLQKRKLDEAKQQHIIQTTLEETKRLDDLCNNLLVSSRIDAGGYKLLAEEVNFTQLAAGTVQQYIKRFPERKFGFSCESDLFVNGDDFLLQMAINNLLDNAVKYSEKDTSVQVHMYQQQYKLYLQVKDNGKGIEDAEKQQIFNRYYRSSSARAKGTGLGLYLVKRIAMLHKANISVTNNIPTGSIFTIEFLANG